MTAINSLTQLSIVRGAVSNVQRFSNTSGHINEIRTTHSGGDYNYAPNGGYTPVKTYISGGGGNISTAHKVTFRINQRPVEYNYELELTDGDNISAAVLNNSREVLFIYNRTTNYLNWSKYDFYPPFVSGDEIVYIILGSSGLFFVVLFVLAIILGNSNMNFPWITLFIFTAIIVVRAF